MTRVREGEREIGITLPPCDLIHPLIHLYLLSVYVCVSGISFVRAGVACRSDNEDASSTVWAACFARAPQKSLFFVIVDLTG